MCSCLQAALWDGALQPQYDISQLEGRTYLAPVYVDESTLEGAGGIGLGACEPEAAALEADEAPAELQLLQELENELQNQ